MIRHWLRLATLLAIIHAGALLAQSSDNMVFNPSFEEHSQCPERISALGIMSEVDAWWQPTRGSSDYFHACGGRECMTPRNKMGVQEPHSGDAYCGIYCSKENYREYLQTELKEPLRKGHHYHVSFWVSLADKSPNAIATLGALFTTDRIGDTTWNNLMHHEVINLGDGQRQVILTPHNPQVQNPVEQLIDIMEGWYEVRGEFVASGGEMFLTLGNFKSFNHSHVIQTDVPNAVLSGAYYYIDDVSVQCLDCVEDVQTDSVPTPQQGDLFTLHNVLFNTDESILLPQSYNDLQKLISLLNAHPSMTIELRGHTDNQGTIEHNRTLSQARAKAVADYLVAHGIDVRRLKWKGYGKSLPIDTNDTPEGRRNNRRVEVRILQN